jgi:hypothetical protein
MIDRLVALSRPNSFHVLYHLFPDNPRGFNDAYFAHALAYLIALSEKQTDVAWLPTWLAGERQSSPPLQGAIHRLIRCCLSHFVDDEPRKIVLLAAATFRRVIKLYFLGSEASWRSAEAMHGFHRFFTPELSWSQILASPAKQILTMLDGSTASATQAFVQGCCTDAGTFNAEVAKLQLRDLWKIEVALLSSFDNFHKLRRERNLEELSCPEFVGVTYDYLGHFTLCLISLFPSWQRYVLQTHHSELQTLASMNSWKAREILNIDRTTILPPPADSLLADRFFFGDVQTLHNLRSRYASPQAGVT